MATNITADANGVVRGQFTIPAGIPAGDKLIAAFGQGGSYGIATFSGQGTLQRQTWQQQTTVTETRWWSPPPPPPPQPPPPVVEWWADPEPPPPDIAVPPQDAGAAGYWRIPASLRRDPLAQTFMLPQTVHLSGVDLWFFERPTSRVVVQVRETSTGFPTQAIVTEVTLEPAQVNLNGNHTRVVFPSPVVLRGNIQYALVVMCNDADGSLHIAELGKYDVNAQRWVTAQPYTVGVLLSSSNAVTWTVHQDRDMTFRLLAASYTQTSRTVDLGAVAVQDATDLMLMAYADRSSSRSFATYTLVLPDGSQVKVDDGQVARMPAPVTGNVRVLANLFGESSFSPVLHPGTQLVIGRVSQSADYVSRAVPAGNDVTVKVILDARIPSGATLRALLRGSDESDTWQQAPLTSTRPVDEGFVEHIFTVTGVTEESVRVKLELTGTAAARPEVANFRIIVM